MIRQQAWSVSKIERLPVSIKRKVSFYAPLIYDLGHVGVGEASFLRGSAATPIWKDEAAHSVGANVPRFEYSNGSPLGIALSSTESLSYHAGNMLDIGTLIWFEDDVVQVAPFNNLNPFPNGVWQGTLDVHVKDVLHFREFLSDYEIGVVIDAMADVGQGAFSPNDWILESPIITGPLTRELSRTPDLSTLLLTAGGVFLRRVASNPGLMQYAIADNVITFGTTFAENPVIRALYRRDGVSGASFSIEDLSGTKNGTNVTFTISQAPTGAVIMIIRSGVALEKVASAPGLMQFSISGTTITLGNAPLAGEDLWTFMQIGGSGFVIENLTGTKDGSNKAFTISSQVTGNTAVAIHAGVGLRRVPGTPTTQQCAISGMDVTVGTAPKSGDALWIFQAI